jgi:hypothetical protein
MDFIGVIAAASDPPGIDQQRWIETIADHPALAPFAARRGINPSTKQPMDYAAHPVAARVVVQGNEVGRMEWAQDDSNQIAVFGSPGLVAPIAEEVAALPGATFGAEPHRAGT